MPAHLRIRTVYNHIKKVSNNLPKAADPHVKAWAEDAKTVWQDLMLMSPPSGRTYYFDPSGQGRPVPHTASSPGNPPRIWTGEYADSVRTFRIQQGVWGVGTDLDKAVILEIGGANIDARPVAGPTAAIVEGDAAKHFAGFESRLL